MKILSATLFILLASLSSFAADNPADALLLQSGKFVPKENIQQFISESIPASEIIDGYYYRIIQFQNFPDEKQKEAIRNSGLLLNMYLPYHAYSCAIPASFDKSKLIQLHARAIVRWEGLNKIQRDLVGTIFPAHTIVERGNVDLVVHYHQNISQVRAIELMKSAGIRVINESDEIQALTVRIPEGKFQALKNLPFIYYIEPIAPPSKKDDTEGRSLHRSNAVNTDYTTGRHYDGSGVVVGLADDGTVGPHIDFTGRLTQHLVSNDGNHGDMTSGICAGAGNLDPNVRGMGTGADLHVFSINGYPQIANAVANYNNFGIVITSTSYSQGCNEYTSTTQSGDQLVKNNSQFSFVFSAGNDGTTDCGYGAGNNWGNITGGYKMGKNVITVGNLTEIDQLVGSSSRGPASDGRIKPDICSNGGNQRSTDGDNTYQFGSGTSAACPGVAGTFSQIYQAYKDITGQPNPSSALIKACVLNTGEDLGNDGPDYKFGWGRINALRAIKTLEDNRYFSDSIAQGETDTFSVSVPSNVRQLRIMLYWTDVAGSPTAAKALVNDLNMQVTDPSVAIFNPWILNPTANTISLNSPAVRGVDTLNNVEQVTIDNPATGNYSITVNGFQIPLTNQKYFIVYEILTDSITVTYPIGGEGLVPGTTEILRWDAIGDTGTFNLRYSTNNGSTWATVANGLPGTFRHFSWNVPGLASDQMLVEVSRNGFSDVSDSVFTVIGVPGNIHVSSACPDSIRLSWNSVANATGYDVSMLGNKYMDFVGTTTGTTFLITGTNTDSVYWFSVKALGPNGGKGRRAIAIKAQTGILNCVLNVDGNIQLLYPAQGVIKNCHNANGFPVTVALHNTGVTTLSNFAVSYKLNNDSVVTENFSGSITTGNTTPFTFTQKLALTTLGNYTLKVWITIVGDQYPPDDTLTSTMVLSAGVLTSIPFLETFESYGLCSTASNCGTTNCAIGGNWTNARNNLVDGIDWRTAEGATPSTTTGPNTDHTTATATGNYVYLEASQCYDKEAVLISPCFDLSGISTPMLTFWYHMFGANMGELHVDVIGENEIVNDIVPPPVANLANAWFKDSAMLTQFNGQIIAIRFRGTTTDGDYGDMALDDIGVIDLSTGVNEISSDQHLIIYPNPGNGVFNYITGNLTGSKQVLIVEDILGKKVYEKTLSGNPYDRTGIIDLSHEAKGVYTVTLRSDKISKQVKLMKVN